MSLPTIDTDNKRWFAARLHAHLRCVLCVGLLCAVIRAEPPGSLDSKAKGHLDGPTAEITIGKDGTKSVMPAGWRRTRNGWEHVSTWPSPGRYPEFTINELLQRQREREPKWIRMVMARISRVPPLMVALIQLTAIAAIMYVAESHRRPRQ